MQNREINPNGWRAANIVQTLREQSTSKYVTLTRAEADDLLLLLDTLHGSVEGAWNEANETVEGMVEDICALLSGARRWEHLTDTIRDAYEKAAPGIVTGTIQEVKL
jgi:hypothetical protein